MIELSAEELRQYRISGRNYLSELAQAIQDSAPAAAASTSIYKNRDISHSRGEQLNAAVISWRKDNDLV
jgi:hypothetical protein